MKRNKIMLWTRWLSFILFIMILSACSITNLEEEKEQSDSLITPMENSLSTYPKETDKQNGTPLVEEEKTAKIKKIVTGYSNTILLTEDNEVWICGETMELADRVIEESFLPVYHAEFGEVIDIDSDIDSDFIIFVKKDGTVWGVGNNFDGQLGNGTDKDSSELVQAKGLENIVSIAAGRYHVLALDENGEVWAWGSDCYGQLGLTDCYDCSYVPVKIPNLSKIIKCAAFEMNSFALDQDGRVWNWGYENYGNNGTVIENTKPPAMLGRME